MTMAKPLAQAYTVIFERPDVAGTMVDTPSIARLPGGRLLASNNIDGSWGGGIGQAGLDREFPGGYNLYIHASDDNGQTWHTLTRLPLADGMLLTLGDEAYVLGTGRVGGTRRDVYVVRSTDGGETWGNVVQIHDGPAWNSATGIVIRNGWLYRAYDTAVHQEGRQLFVLAGDTTRDLLAPESWRCSNTVGFPGLPQVMKRPVAWSFRDHWLEPNVVDIRGRLTVIARCRIDDYGTCHIAGVCDLSDTDGDLRLEFTQFHPFLGAQQKFHILYDEVSDFYWMVGNLVTDPQNHTGWYPQAVERGYKGGAGNERRILALFYSLDSLNWLQAGVVAMSADPMQGFMYSQMLIEGNDLLFAVRTSKDRGNNHDAELVTFHRLPQFRSLALDIHLRLRAK
ncbi:MAG: exo-alpha-sialidase [Victivallales bacterium]|nr:exo-alpha-sialidase [Victivallales bacterium]